MFRKISKVFIFLVLCTIILFSYITTHANDYVDEPKCKNGAITFTTEDKKATTKVTWSTIGFNIRRDKSDGNPLKDKSYATLYLDKKWKKEKDNNTTVFVSFTIPKEAVDEALIKAGFDDIQDNDVIYLNGIFKVTDNGTVLNKEYHKLTDIQGAKEWSATTKKDFENRFDVKVNFKAGKYKVEIEYRTPDNVILSKKIDSEALPGKEKKITLDKNIGSYELFRSYIINMSKPNTKVENRKLGTENTLNQVRNRTSNVKIGGLKFVGVMKLPKIKVKDIEEGKLEDKLIEPIPSGVIAADVRDNEAFDVAEGIPSSENLYVNVLTTDYLIGYKFNKIKGKETYPISVSKKYILTWYETIKDEEGNDKVVERSGSKTVNKIVNVERDYAYWVIDNLEMYHLDNATVNNEALPDKAITIKANIPIPNVKYTHSNNKDDHIIHPDYPKSITLPEGHALGTSAPNEDFLPYVNNQVGNIIVKNDKLTIDGDKVMSNEKAEREGPEPEEIDISPEEIGEDVLYAKGLTIPSTKANGIYSSNGTVTYKSLALINTSKTDKLTYPIHNLNSVTVHTPTICNGEIESSMSYNQMITPDISATPLVLDTTFSILIDTVGTHRNIKGYQYNEYKKYISDRQVKFPFDVYKGTEYIAKDTWISIPNKTSFYIPLWVQEGTYTIDLRSIAINSNANSGINKTEPLMNSQLSSYVATDTIKAEVSGRVFDLNIYDISDYPIWERAFRQKNSLNHTGFNYTIGTKNRNGEETGQNSKYTLTLVNGSHPEYNNQGVLKTGYAVRYSLTTMGNMWSDKDYINIKPIFYFVDKNGKNRQEVDIYYSETFGGKKQVLVKMGSNTDKTNIKKLSLGDSYLSVPQTEIQNTANIRGINEKYIKGDLHNIFTYTNIKLPIGLRTFAGTLSNLKTINPVYENIPSQITQNTRIKSLQKWYGEYYLPGEIHAVKKDFDVQSIASKQSINYKENFWLKNGYIIVNFEIETIKDGKRHLSYINQANEKDGYNNMWKTEGYQYTKTDSKGTNYTFKDGDFILYYAGKSIANDYISGGTH